MPKKSHYDNLGIPRNASKDEIKKAYRKKAKKAHPDKGGTHEQFTRLLLAYNTLSDDEKRKRYDETGSDKEPVNLNAAAMERMIPLVRSIINKCQQAAGAFDLIALLEENVFQVRKNIEGAIQKNQQSIKRTREILNRIKPKENPFAPVLEADIEGFESAIESAKQEMLITDECLKILLGLEYEQDKQLSPLFKILSDPEYFLYGPR